MKKIYFIIISLTIISLAGCKKQDLANFKELDLDFCNKFTIQEFETLYFKDSSWEKDKGTYIWHATSNINNEKEEIEMKLVKEGITAKVTSLKINGEKVAKKESLDNICSKAKIIAKGVKKKITVPIKAEYNEEKYVLENIPETVELTLIGTEEEIAQVTNNPLILNLTAYEPNNISYTLKLNYNLNNSNVVYELNPSEINFKVSNKIAKIMPITKEVIGIEEEDISKIIIQPEEVVVKSSLDILDQVSTIKTTIDLEKLYIKKGGTYQFKLKNNPLKAYDANGNEISTVEIVPQYIDTEIITKTLLQEP